MKCLVCRGACCESFSADIVMIPASRDATRWLELHATEKNGPTLTFECRCVALTSKGLCAIHEDRPMVCELFVAGSKACLDTVRKRRTPEEYQEIRDDDDPELL